MDDDLVKGFGTVLVDPQHLRSSESMAMAGFCLSEASSGLNEVTRQEVAGKSGPP